MSSQEKKVFIVEDNLEMSRMYERAFRLHGFGVEMAYDGQSALEKLKAGEEVPQVVILDVMIPHMNGADVLKAIRDDERLKDVPVAILTNSFQKDDEQRFLELGADLYLVKIENTSKDILEKIETLISSRTNAHE